MNVRSFFSCQIIITVVVILEARLNTMIVESDLGMEDGIQAAAAWVGPDCLISGDPSAELLPRRGVQVGNVAFASRPANLYGS